jgi:hypothetical protein
MILIEAGQFGEKYLDAKILFASLLAARGHHVAIDDASIPKKLNRQQQYESSRFLCRREEICIEHLVVIGAENISDKVLMALRSYELGPDTILSAIGRFSDRQSLITSQSKLAYATGFEPRLLDLAMLQERPILTNSICPLVAVQAKEGVSQRRVPNVLLFLPADFLDEPLTLPVIGAMSRNPKYSLHIVTSGLAKDQIAKSKYHDLSVFSYSELSPAAFAQVADFAIFLGKGIPGERFAAFALQLMRSGGVVIDCTETNTLTLREAPVMRGPSDIVGMIGFFDNGILSLRTKIADEVSRSEWIKGNSIERLEVALSLAPPRTDETTNSKAGPKTVFIPTNGVGLGHAQRCSVIAASLPKSVDCSFAAFPSCLPLLQAKGFPCIPLVQKSESHADGHANDIVNYLRLRRLVRTGDHLVFDGGFIFDSIYRTIVEKSLKSTWIRRGLWQPGQDNRTSLEREKVFDQVIVPTEAFSELNTDYSFGENVHRVGPIVQNIDHGTADRELLRNRLKVHFDRDFENIVVTMLGGGVAADRSAQVQVLCGLFEHRDDCLNLVVVWPNSKVPPGVFGWKNSHVVSTKNALSVCLASDLVVSAVGYNSFHEVLYHGIPAIFVPQMAPYMDDQERRARAASDRGYSATVLATELLMLEREVSAFLDDGKAQKIRDCLVSANFPEPGNYRAAKLIEEGLTR